MENLSLDDFIINDYKELIEDIKCNICFTVKIDIYECKHCNKLICYKCLKKYTNKNCFNCFKKISLQKLDKDKLINLKNFLMKCKCSNIIHVKELDTHYQNCFNKKKLDNIIIDTKIKDDFIVKDDFNIIDDFNIKDDFFKKEDNDLQNITFYKNGSVKEIGVFEGKKLNGYGIKYWENGNVKIKGFFKDDQPHKNCTIYDVNGKIVIDNYDYDINNNLLI